MRRAATGLALAALTACALPGPPQGRPGTNPTAVTTDDCPGLEATALRADGLELGLVLPAATRAGTPVVLYRAAGDAPTLTPFREIVLDDALAGRVRDAQPLGFLDAELPPTRPLRVTYALELIDERGAACPLPQLDLELPAAPSAPAPPAVRAVGLAVRVEAPGDATATVRLLRRSIHERQREPVVLERAWATDEGVYIDVDVEPGGIYAYSLQNTAPVATSAVGDALELEGPRSAEAYAPVVAPDRLIDLEPTPPAP